jgi:hypothetical protein
MNNFIDKFFQIKFLVNNSILLSIIFIFISISSISQVAISYPVAAQNITTNYFNSALTVRLDFNQDLTSGCNVKIALPGGINYVSGSVSKISSTAGLTITYSGGTANAPEFSIAPGNLIIGNYIVFSILRDANCSARVNSINGTIFKDAITTTTSAGIIQDISTAINTYIVGYPAFSLGQPTAIINAVVGQIATRTFTISNGGNGCTENVYLNIDYPAGDILQLSLKCNDIPISPVSTVGTVNYYTISGAILNASQEFCNGNILVFTEQIKILRCDGLTNYNTGWGPNSSLPSRCQTDTGVGTVTMASGAANFSSMEVTNLNYVNACTPWNVRMRMTNTATGNLTAGAMYNVKPTMGLDFYSSTIYGFNYAGPSPFYQVNATNFRIGSTPVPITTINFAQTFQCDTSLFLSDPDGFGIGLDDLDGDGQYDDLASGQYVDLIFLYEFNCPAITAPCAIGSTDGFGYHGPVGSLYYNEMCGTFITPPGKRSLVYANYFGQSQCTPNFINPPQIIGGVPFTINLNTFFGSISFPVNPDGRYIWKVTMPAGVSVSGTGNATTDGSNPFPFTQSGQVLTFNYGDTTYRDMFINLVYTCGASTDLVFNATLTRFADTAANCKCYGNFLCQDFTIKATCPGPCALGPSSDKPIVRRSDESLGYTDYTMATRRTAASLTTNQLQRAMYLQTIQITGKAIQNNLSTNMHVELELDKTPSGADKLVPVSAVVSVKRGTLIINTITYFASNFVTTASTATKTNMDLNVTSCFNGTGVRAGDEVSVVAKYQVATNDLPYSPILASGVVWRYYNLNGGGTKDFCYDWKPQFYFLGTYVTHDNFYYYGFSAGCNTSVPQILERNCYAGGTQLFPNEYIPGRNFMKFTLTIPTGFEFDRLTLGNGGRGYGEPTVILTPSSQTATTVTFENDGSWFPIPITQEIYYAEVWIQPFFRPTCAVVNPVNIPNSGEYIKVKSNDFYYSNNVPIGTIPTDNSLQSNYTYYHGPSVPYPVSSQIDLKLSNQSGVIQATKPSESFVLRFSNVGANTAPYNWIAIPDTAGINIVQVVSVATALPVTSIPYSGGKIYNLSVAGLAPGLSTDYRIDFNYSVCNTTSFPVIGGWNCSSYPIDPDLYTCSKENLLLTFTPSTAEVLVAQQASPITGANLCTPKGYSFEVNNAQASNVYNSTFRLTMPIGLVPVGGSFEAEYPRGSGNWQFIPPPTINAVTNEYTYNLSAHTAYPIQGIPGTLNSLTLDDRFISIRFLTNTDCSYVPGTKLQYSTAANRSCGLPAIGSDINFLSGY